MQFPLLPIVTIGSSFFLHSASAAPCFFLNVGSECSRLSRSARLDRSAFEIRYAAGIGVAQLSSAHSVRSSCGTYAALTGTYCFGFVWSLMRRFRLVTENHIRVTPGTFPSRDMNLRSP
jgi:hypothetical protein